MYLFEPTYKSIDDYMTSFDKYQEELLKAFELREFNLETINKKIDELYVKIEKDPAIRQELEKYKKIYKLDGLEFILCIMFSWNHFHHFYPLISQHIENYKEEIV